MAYSTFRLENNDHLIEPMFLGKSVNVSRFDEQRYPIFESLIEKQLSFFWRPEEVDISKDRADWQSLTAAEQQLVKTLPAEKGRGLLKQVRTQLMETARAWAGKMTQVAPLALQSVKELMRAIEGETVQSAFNTMRTADLPNYRKLLVSDDAEEGVAAFVEKRDAKFKGA